MLAHEHAEEELGYSTKRQKTNEGLQGYPGTAVPGSFGSYQGHPFPGGPPAYRPPPHPTAHMGFARFPPPPPGMLNGMPPPPPPPGYYGGPPMGMGGYGRYSLPVQGGNPPVTTATSTATDPAASSAGSAVPERSGDRKSALGVGGSSGGGTGGTSSSTAGVHETGTGDDAKSAFETGDAAESARPSHLPGSSSASGPKGGANTVLVFGENELSMEEIRAKLDMYRYIQ